MLFRAPVTTAARRGRRGRRGRAGRPRLARGAARSARAGWRSPSASARWTQQRNPPPVHGGRWPCSSSPSARVGGWYLTGRWLEPGARHGGGGLRGGQGRLSRESLKVESDDEMGVLAQSLNEMVGEPAPHRGQHPGDLRAGGLLGRPDLRQRQAHHAGRAEPGPGRGGDLHLDGGDGRLHPDRGRQRPEPGHLRGGDHQLHHRDGRLHRGGGASPAPPWPAP